MVIKDLVECISQLTTDELTLMLETINDRHAQIFALLRAEVEYIDSCKN